jgi:transcriptional regulator NrdR family protein
MKRRKLTAENMFDGKGLHCQRCGCRHFITLRTERIARKIRRTKACRNCHKRYITLEEISHEGR